MPRLNLRTKLLGSFMLVLLPVLALLVYDYREENERRIQTVLDDQMQTAQAIAAMVDASFDEAMAVAWALTTDPIVHSLDPSQLDPHLQRLTPYYPGYETIAVVDAAGTSVGSSLPYAPGEPRVRADDRPWFQQVVTTGQPVVSEVLLSRRTQRPSILVAVPLRDENARTVGAVIVIMFLDALSDRLESVSLAPGQNIILVDRAATIAIHTALPDVEPGQRDLSQFKPIVDALEGRPTKVRLYVSPLTGDDHIGAFTPTPNPSYAWAVGVTIPEDVALAPVRASLRTSLAGFLLVAVLSISFVILFSHLFLQPIRSLIDHALSLAQGQLNRRVSIKTGDELEKLASTLNYMAGQLEMRDAENARLSRLKDEFLSVAAHELKTPVTGIKGYAQLLLRTEHEGLSPRGRLALEAINRQSDRITRLVNELLDVTRIQTGRLALNLSRADLGELAAEVVERIGLTTDKHHLILHLPSDPVFVNADRDRIEQVIGNLLDNAIKFSPRGGEIETTVEAVGAEAVLSVRDKGVGIPKDRQPHIFERFYRAHTGTPFDYGGMGIALNISLEVVQRHGGRMWFESEEGKGSTFYFSLPLA